MGGHRVPLVAAFVGWLLFLTWQRLTLPERLMRTAVLVLLALAVAIVPDRAGLNRERF